MAEETYREEYSKKNPESANIKDIVTVIKSMITFEPEFAMKHLFASHCLQLFMKYFSCRYIHDFYLTLFDRNDHSMNLTIKLRENLYKYAY
jgi:hypothetical protein